MGMFLIESLVDEVEWVSSPCSGSYARLVIRLHPNEEAEAIVIEQNDGGKRG
jgi:anti-sigma regulatory factor (Ser/Thr protein kinase)